MNMPTQTQTQTHICMQKHTQCWLLLLSKVFRPKATDIHFICLFLLLNTMKMPPPPPPTPPERERERERICSSEGNVESHTLIMRALTVTLAFKIRIPLFFFFSLSLSISLFFFFFFSHEFWPIIHHHVMFGYKRFCSSQDIFWTNIS